MSKLSNNSSRLLSEFDPLDNEVCPFPEREYCEGCGNYIEEEGICAKELAI